MPDETPRHSYEQRAYAGQLLSRVSGMDRDRVRAIAQDLTELYSDLRFDAPNTPEELTLRLGAGRRGLDPLRDLIGMREDYFPNNSATRDLIEYLQMLCGAAPTIGGTPVILRRIREAQTRPGGGTGMDSLWLIREAFFATLDKWFSGGHPISQEPPPDRFPAVIDYLLRHGSEELGIKMVLEFIARLASLSGAEEAEALRECLGRLVAGLPAYEAELSELEQLMKLYTIDALRRTHVLVRVERDIDCDPEDPVADQLLTVTIWSYKDDRHGNEPPPHPRGRLSEPRCTRTISGAALAAEVRAQMPRAADDRTVVELMADDTTFASGVLDDVIAELGGEFAVVVRPRAASAVHATWFANWQSVLKETDFVPAVYDDAAFAPAPTCSALVVATHRRPKRISEALLGVNVPIAAWRRHGGAIDDEAESCVRASFATPELFQRDRRDDLLPPDAVLMWHNPHWFPDGRTLRWRQAEVPHEH
ncbi:hypothetical protein AB0M36_23230 [Actinoplanes sp. NPDC051346]|uniref:hypothetical protein n=1 Tax=Actinoplanes sp. NPDC051346 TaxID=3155048 RepID=UPI0034499056